MLTILKQVALPISAVALIIFAATRNDKAVNVPAESHGAQQVRVVHILNWHYLPKDVFAADVRANGTLTDEEIDALYDDFLNDVESVQQEQIEVLTAMVARDGLTEVFYEGVTPDNLADFNERIELLREFEKVKPAGDSPIE